MTHRIAGIELGGTKCVATLCDDQRRILDQTIVPTTSPDVTLPALSAILARWDRNTPFSALGIGSFGPLCLTPHSSEFGHITATAKPGWRDADVLGSSLARTMSPAISTRTSMPPPLPKGAGAPHKGWMILPMSRWGPVSGWG
jgi:predicted NBD/HSP70 family sugar kinase